MRKVVVLLLVSSCLPQPRVLAQAGVGSGAYCMPDYSNKPCNQPNVSNDPSNYVNDFIDSFNTTGGVTNISTNNTGCQAQLLGGITQNYFSYGCPTHLRANAGSVITCNFLSGVIFGQGFAVFVDWNKDCSFTVAERVCGTSNVPAPATWTAAAFTIPATTLAGAYKMRVRCAYATPGTSIDPCLLYGFGETQDYTLFIGSVCTATLPVCSALPVRLTSYSAIYRGNCADVEWKTASETNNSYFTLEKSQDLNSFVLIDKVFGAGNSHLPQKYQVTDNYPFKGITYYRLQQFDKDGVMGFSEVIKLETDYQNNGLQIYPSPAGDMVEIELPEYFKGKTIRIELSDPSGRKQFLEEIIHVETDSTKISLNVSKVNKGFYFISFISDNGDVANGKFLKE